MSKCKITGKKLVIQLGRTDIQIVAMNGSTILYGKTYETPVGAVEDGMIRNQEAVRELLKGAMKEPEFKGIRQVVFTLCTSQVISEVVATPDLPASRLEKLLQANVDMYFPVDMHDYKLVWQVIGPKRSEGGAKEVNVQLWAMPVNMVTRYYQVANACGLSVAAIDYIGNSIAGAIGASFAENAKGGKTRKKLDLNAEISFGKKKAEPAPAAEENLVRENPATQLHLLLEKDILGMTFVQNGQVMVQRFVRCGSDPTYQFGELAMMLEYFRAMDIGRGSSIEGIVSGALAEESGIVQELEDIMGISLFRFNASYDLGWFLCVGAACTALDFGIPALNKPGTVRREFQSQLWQYGLLLAGGLAVLFVVLTLLTSRLGWNSDISSLKNTQQMLTIQNSKVAGYADNYYDYESKYNAYSNDWETVFASLQTYNDNLVLVMEELEEVMPEKVNVVNMQIGATGLNVAFACDTKEEAAYLITALDKLEYAELIRPVSDLLGGGGGAAKTYGSGTKKEAAPTEGGSDITVEAYAWNEQAFLEMAMGMTPAELTDLEVYAQKDLRVNSSMSDVQNNVSLDDRKAALKEMFTSNPFATNRMMSLMKKDAQAESADTILVTGGVMFELYPYRSVMTDGLPADPVEAEALIDGILSVLAKDEARLQNTEALMATDDFVAASYILHVDGDNEMLYYLDTGALYQDAKKGTFKTTNDNVTAKLEILLADVPKAPDETIPDETTPDETIPDETKPEETKPQETYEDSEAALKKLLSMENVGDPILAGRVNEYISTGEILNDPEEADALDAYVQSGALDAQLENWLALSNGNQDYDTNGTIMTMLSNYKANKGNTVLNARLKVVEDQMKPEETKPDETKPDETKPGETTPDETEPGDNKDDMKMEMIRVFMTYWKTGKVESDDLDETQKTALAMVFEEYVKTGSFEKFKDYPMPEEIKNNLFDEETKKTIDLYFAQFMVKNSLSSYILKGVDEKNEPYGGALIDTYFKQSGETGKEYLDDQIDALLEANAVKDELMYQVSAFRKAGKIDHKVLNDLVATYEKEDTTDIWALDKALRVVYHELLTNTDPTNPTNPTDPTETTPGESKPEDSKDDMKMEMIRVFMTYWKTGKVESDDLDETQKTALAMVFEEYVKTGSFEKFKDYPMPEEIKNNLFDEETKKTIDLYFAQFMVKNSLSSYILKGVDEKNEPHSSVLIDNYFKQFGVTENEYLDKQIDALLEAHEVKDELMYQVSMYRKAGKIDHKVLSDLINGYEKKDTTNIWSLDKALRTVYYELLTATTKQAAQQASAGIAKDNHLYFSVYLNYKEDLRNAELNRKGLDYEKKIEKLEVGE